SRAKPGRGHSAIRAAMFDGPLPQLEEQIVGVEPAAIDLLLRLSEVVLNEEPFLGPIVVEPREQVVDLTTGDPDPKMISRHRLDRMGLIKNQDVVIGQDA